MKNTFKCSGAEYDKLIDRFTNILTNNNKIFFSGSFGVGKTTFLNTWEAKHKLRRLSFMSEKVEINKKNYHLVKINAFVDFHSESFIEVLESNLFNPFSIFFKKYFITLLIISSPLVILIFKWTELININESTYDIALFTIALCSMLVAFHQYRQNTIVENRIKRIRKKCLKHNYLFIIDDFDRLSHSHDDSVLLNTSDKNKILKIMNFVESKKNIIIFVGNIKSNNMNFLEKYYDYIYEFPTLHVLNVIKSQIINHWENIINARDNSLDKKLFYNFKSYFFNQDRESSIRDIIRLSNHLEIISMERLNISEVILTHYLYYLHYEEYRKIFIILRDKKLDSMNKKHYTQFKTNCFTDENKYSDGKLKGIVSKWLNIEEWNKDICSLIYIKPPGNSMEFQTCHENYYIYMVNQFDNNEYTYIEFKNKIFDINYWLNYNETTNNADSFYNINRFYYKLKKDGLINDSIKYLLNNIYKLENINDVRTLIQNINYLSNWDMNASYGDYYKDIPDIEDIDCAIQGKIIYLSQILMYEDSKLSDEKEKILTTYLIQCMEEVHTMNDEYLCDGWLSLFFYTKYAKYIDEEISLNFWHSRDNLTKDIHRYFFQKSILYEGYFQIGKDAYDNEIKKILNEIDDVPEAIKNKNNSQFV